jgi:hypothetical protein
MDSGKVYSDKLIGLQKILQFIQEPVRVVPKELLEIVNT